MKINRYIGESMDTFDVIGLILVVAIIVQLLLL
jgi:hypothetical protein